MPHKLSVMTGNLHVEDYLALLHEANLESLYDTNSRAEHIEIM